MERESAPVTEEVSKEDAIEPRAQTRRTKHDSAS